MIVGKLMLVMYILMKIFFSSNNDSNFLSVNQAFHVEFLYYST